MIKTQKKEQRKKRKGFTLIELIIVLAVMAIIAAIAIPNFAAVRDSSKNKADVQSAETIKRTVLMLVSDETIKAGTKTITFTDGNSIADADFVGFVAGDDKEAVKAALKEVKKPQGKITKGDTNVQATKYSVEIKADGSVLANTVE